MVTPEDVIAFWFDEVGPKGWFGGGEALDEEVRQRFGAAWTEASEGGYGFWLMEPRSALAYLILVDQFPRNMFREDPRAFSTDPSARAAANGAIEKRWDLELDETARSFVYLPLMHSEDLADQDRAIALIRERLPEDANSLLHAEAHREIIARFGRFPFRNKALGRSSSPEETVFLEGGGYGAVVRALRGDDAETAG